jgi:hypothetical protein
MSVGWIDLLGASFFGGIAVKGLDFLYQEYRRKSETRKSARDLVDRHLDPILKAADELVGKIRSLAQSDFRELVRAGNPKDIRFDHWFPYLDIAYLFAQFWSRIQIMRMESIFVNLSSDHRGGRLLDFVRTLESTKTRLFERARERGIGETLIEYQGPNIRMLTYKEFVEHFLSSMEFRQWFLPLISILTQLNHTRTRQRLLVYGAILHALIDSLDHKHLVTGERPGWANKFTTKSRRSLKFLIFAEYLPFVTEARRYYAK